MNRLLVSGLCLFSQAALAADEAAPFDAVSGGKILETLLGLALVLLLIFGLARLLQHLQGGPRGGSQTLQIVSSMSLGTREKVMLLQVAGKHILIASTPQSIAALHVFEEPLQDLPEPGPTGSSFSNLLQSIGPGTTK